MTLQEYLKRKISDAEDDMRDSDRSCDDWWYKAGVKDACQDTLYFLEDNE